MNELNIFEFTFQNPELPGGQQYCLKWNNHNKNISGVFERLRSNESFVDVTLASADQKIMKCHRIVLSAGSGYVTFLD